MIGRLKGELIEVEGNMALVDAGGVGYEVLLPDAVLMRLPAPGEQVELRIRQIFREDGVSLYGFMEPFQRRMFDMLIEVKGCGPKIGLALLGQLGEEAVANAILTQDAKSLARASGVGPRLAERIILELKDKMAGDAFQRKVEASLPKKPITVEDELIDALLALGYRRAEAEDAARDAREQADGVEEQLRHALRLLKR